MRLNQSAAPLCSVHSLVHLHYPTTGLYLLDVFRERLGVFSVDHKRFNPESDFGGLPSDPLVKNASDFLSEFNQGNYEIGAAFSCDGTRALIITQDGLPVTVSTSLAVVAENLQWFPFFKKSKDVKGFGRSLCTSRAVDRVAAALGIPCYEVSHNQIYFNRLMDEGKITLFGDELNGVSFCHVREYDGIWLLLAWLSIYMHKKLAITKNIVKFWDVYGRHVFCKFEVKNCTFLSGKQMLKELEFKIKSGALAGKLFRSKWTAFKFSMGDNFCCFNPTSEHEPTNEGVRILFTNGSRLIFQVANYGNDQTTISIWVDSYGMDFAPGSPEEEIASPLLEIALQIAEIKKYTGQELAYYVI
ncbi:phosphoglucomutase/phosphomannomutase, alpha/beta/alpha domain III [Trichuris suis]|nr:phosphoglucomutase/phosphomannomutase, alpha/beta/alpha domain III [Trichuris suis]